MTRERRQVGRGLKFRPGKPLILASNAEKKVDPKAKTGWDNPCRQISPQCLVKVLTVPKWRDQLAKSRVRLSGVHIEGPVDLTNTNVGPEIQISESRIEGDLNLTDSHLQRRLSLEGSVLTGSSLPQECGQKRK
jgi:hypothetical protein